MSNKYFDWPKSLLRFVSRDSARAEDVNVALDLVSFGLDTVQQDVERSIRVPSGDAQVIALTPLQRAGLVLAFDAAGNVTAVAGGGRFRGDWITGALYVQSDVVRDPVSKNLYSAASAHTAGALAADIAAGRMLLALDVAEAEAAKAAAAASAADANTSRTQAQAAEAGASASATGSAASAANSASSATASSGSAASL